MQCNSATPALSLVMRPVTPQRATLHISANAVWIATLIQPCRN